MVHAAGRVRKGDSGNGARTMVDCRSFTDARVLHPPARHMVNPSARRVLLGIYLGVLLTALLLPVPRVPLATVDGIDKVAHVALFLGLGVLATWSASGTRAQRIRLGVVVVLAWGVITELLQIALPYRSGDPLDLVADIAGGLLGAVVGSLTRAAAR